MSDDNAVTDEAVRERLLTAIDDTERTTSDFRAIMTGDSDNITLSSGVVVKSVPALVVARASSLMSRAVDAGDKAVESADNAKTSEENAQSSANAARNASNQVESGLEAMGPLVSRAESSATAAQGSASEALKSQQAAQQAAQDASGAALGDVAGAQIESQETQARKSIQSWINQFSRADLVLDDVAALRNHSVEIDGETVYCKCHTYKGYGGGVFIHDPSDSSSADNGGSVIVTESGARYKRAWETDDSNVLDWGAYPHGDKDDPRNSIDVGPVCRRMVDSGVITLHFPNFQFMVDSTIESRYRNDKGETRFRQIQITGNQWDYYGSNADRACLFAGPNLKHDPSRDDVNTSILDDPDEPDRPVVGFSMTGWMFNNVRSARFLSFQGTGRGDDKACGIYTNGYVARIQYCCFNGFNACLAQINCDSRVLDCSFTGSKYCAVSIEGANLVTTVTYSRNEHQWCTYGFYSSAQVWGSTFEDNVWEHCGSQLCNAQLFRCCQFLTNWIEAGGGTEANGNKRAAFVSRTSQQALDNFTFGNTYHYGTWKTDLFSQPDGDDENNTPADGATFAGVSMEKGQVQVRASNGYGVTLHRTGITQLNAQWIRHPLTFKTGRQYNNGGGSSIVLDSSENIELKARLNRVSMPSSSGGSSTTALSWPLNVNTAEGQTDARLEIQPGRDGIPRLTFPYRRTRAAAPADAEGTSRYEVKEYTHHLPFMVQWQGEFSRGQGDTRRCAYFDYSERNDDHVTLVSDEIETRDPKIFVQVENNPDIEFVRWEALSSYSGSWGVYKVAKGFRFFFRNKETKAPVIPESFVAIIQTAT